MTALAALTLSALLAMPAPDAPSLPEYRPAVSGVWSQYGRAPTDGQLWWHTTQTKLLADPERYDAFIAVVSCELVGQEALSQVDGSRWLRAWIYDCSGHKSTTDWFKSAGIIGELDWYTARALGIPEGRGVEGKLHIVERDL